MRNFMQRWLLIMCLGLFFVSAKVYSVQENFVFETKAQQEDFEHLLKELRCVTCPNQNIADSYAPVAKAMQEEIYVRLKNKESVETIRAYLLSHYGDYVFYRPGIKQSTWLLWGGPFIMLLVGSILWLRMVFTTKRAV